MSNRPPTGSDVARAAGVSKSAVSRAYTGGFVSEDARKRIMEAARLLKYRPNMTARSLTTSESKLIGLAITHLDNQFYPEVVQRLHEGFRRAGYRMVLFITQGEADLEPVLDELLGYRLDGVVLASSSMAAHVATECQAAGVPVVMFNNIDPDAQTAGICSDNLGGGALVARFLAAAGHRRVGLVSGLAESSTSIERCVGFTREVERMGGMTLVEACGEYTFEGAARATQSLLSRPDAPDALFCVNDHMALAACQSARDMGKVPGEDISIVGFDNVQIAAWPTFALTTYAQAVDVMVEEAVSGLVAAIAGNPLPHETRHIVGRLIVRGSARRPEGVVIDGDGLAVWRGAPD